MTNLLSQEEVDALLRGMDSGEIETETQKPPAGEVQPFDFVSYTRVIRGRMPGLDMANEHFARQFRNSLSSMLMKFVDVVIRGHDLIKFGEFMRTLPIPSSINIFTMEPLKGNALMVFEAPTVFAFVDQFFGGGAQPWVKSEGRYFTPIEQKIIRKIVDTALRDLAGAWEKILPIQPTHVNSEMNPQFVTIVTPSEAVIRIEVEIEIENFVGKSYLCIPYSLIEPIKDKLYSGIRSNTPAHDQRWIARLREVLKDSQVTVQVELGKAELSLRDLMNMSKGDVLTLNTSVNEELTVTVEGVPKMKGTPGYHRGNQGIRITQILE